MSRYQGLSESGGLGSSLLPHTACPWGSSTTGGTAPAAAPRSRRTTAWPNAERAATSRTRTRPRRRALSGRRRVASSSPAGAGSPTPGCGICRAGSSGRRASAGRSPPGAARGDRSRSGAGGVVRRIPRRLRRRARHEDGPEPRLEARVVGGTPRAADDVSELRWFARDELPPLATSRWRSRSSAGSKS